jgi:outer membrane protein OmpA-like peptidoglycan-associated protein
VRDALIDTRVAARTIGVTSHGEAELLVPTADNVFEPRNRRVDVIVR